MCDFWHKFSKSFEAVFLQELYCKVLDALIRSIKNFDGKLKFRKLSNASKILNYSSEKYGTIFSESPITCPTLFEIFKFLDLAQKISLQTI